MFNGLCEDVASIEEFSVALDRFDRAEMFEVCLWASGGPSITMLRNQRNAWLLYLRHDQDAGFRSEGQPTLGGTASYLLSNGQFDEYPLSWCLDVEQCFKALAYFFINDGARPDWVSWCES